MAKTLLVSREIESVKDIIEALENRGFGVGVALWAVLAEYGDWRLILCSRQLDKLELAEAYGRVHEALADAGFSVYNEPTVAVFRMSDPFIKDLRRAYSKLRNIEGMRLGGQSFGGRFVEDAYVYRIS
jgi:hypothetical protein